MSYSRVSSLSTGRIVLGYAFISILWIAFSDAVVTHFKLPSAVMTIKGTVFVFVTASLLYFTIRRFVRALQLTSQENELRLHALLQLSQMAEQSVQRITDLALEKAVELTKSKIAYLAFLDEDESVLTMHSSPRTATEQCHVEGTPRTCPVAETGLWREAVRQRRPVITNDYASPDLCQKGCPPGHVEVGRHMNIPVFEGGRIVAVAGVGNKETEYDESDVRELTLLMVGLWRLLQRKQAEDRLRHTAEALRRSEGSLAEAQRLGHTGSWVWDVASNMFTYSSEENSRIYGVDRQEDLETEAVLRIVHPDDRDMVKNNHARSLREKVDTSDEFRIVLADGTMKYIHAIRHPVLNDAGDVVQLVGTTMDITERKRAEEERRLNAERFRAVADYTYDWENWIGVDGKLLWVNLAVERITGYSVDECMAMPDFPTPIIAEADRETVARQMREAVQGSSRNDFEFRVRRKDGRLAWVAASWQPIYDSRGARLGYRSSIRDIAKRKQTEEALRRSEAVLAEAQRLSHTGSWVWDPIQRKFLYASEEMLRLYGFDPQKGIPTPEQVLERIHPDDRGKIKHTRTGEADVDFEYKYVLPDGTLRHFHCIAHPLAGSIGEVQEVLGIAADITERKQAQEALQQLLAELELRVKERTKELSEANEALKAANKELESFSYSVSHDLRGPLLTIDGFSQMVLKGYGNKLDDEGRRKLNLVCSSTEQMGHLIDDLLAFSRLGRKEMVNANVDMDALVRSAWKELTLSNPERRIQLSIERLPHAMGDQALIKEVVGNLLSNAVKFTKIRETAVVEVGAYPEEKRNVYFVKDNGVGFDMQYYNKLFGVFQRLHSDDEFEGTGVGLAIVQRIIRRHGGRVWAEGKMGEGASFYFTLTRSDA